MRRVTRTWIVIIVTNEMNQEYEMVIYSYCNVRLKIQLKEKNVHIGSPHPSLIKTIPSHSLSLYIYTYMHIYVCIYIYIYNLSIYMCIYLSIYLIVSYLLVELLGHGKGSLRVEIDDGGARGGGADHLHGVVRHTQDPTK